jgi:hypothetical protein
MTLRIVTGPRHHKSENTANPTFGVKNLLAFITDTTTGIPRRCALSKWSFEEDKWELYNLEQDISGKKDIVYV